jgi:hypothetical protein
MSYQTGVELITFTLLLTMSYTGPSFSLHVKYTVDPSNVDAFLEALKPAYDAVTAEPECIFFEVYTSASEPGVIKYVENWNASMEWLMSVSESIHKCDTNACYGTTVV